MIARERIEPGISRAMERCYITVMFCDMIDSTRLSEKLDTEDLSELFRLYQEFSFKVVYKYQGHIARIIGDGLLIYFGYLIAHEDDAHQAVKAGLEIIRSLIYLSHKTMALCCCFVGNYGGCSLFG